MITGAIHRILSPSFVDGPGSRMAVFLQGCNLRCLFCHNPETWSLCSSCGACVPGCPGKALELEGGLLRHDPARCRECDACLQACPRGSSPRCRVWEVDALLQRVHREAPFLEGITFSGGECSLQADFILEAARRIQQALRDSDCLARHGGEEFTVLLEGAGREEAFRVGERIRARLAQTPIPFQGQAIPIRASLGVAVHPGGPGADPEGLLAEADRALYRAKAEGRDRICG